MIRTETFFVGEQEMIRTWSDSDVKIHGGSPEGDYDEATDPAEFGRTYTETDIPVESEETNEGDKAIGMVDALLGE